MHISLITIFLRENYIKYYIYLFAFPIFKEDREQYLLELINNSRYIKFNIFITHKIYIFDFHTYTAPPFFTFPIRFGVLIFADLIFFYKKQRKREKSEPLDCFLLRRKFTGNKEKPRAAYAPLCLVGCRDVKPASAWASTSNYRRSLD